MISKVLLQPQPRSAFRSCLEATLASHSNINHPLFAELAKPERQDTLLRLVALQGYQLTKQFAMYIGGLYHNCPSAYYRKRLAINLYEEETGKLSRTANHQALMEKFICALGISEVERDTAIVLPETQNLINYRWKLVNDSSTFHMGAAAIMIASEGQNLERKAGKLRHDLFPEAYGLTPDDMTFFSVHAKEDVYHVQEGLDLVSDICTNTKMQQDALSVIHETCKLFWHFYDGIYDKYQLNHNMTQNLTKNKIKSPKETSLQQRSQYTSSNENGVFGDLKMTTDFQSILTRIQDSIGSFPAFHAAFRDLEQLLLRHEASSQVSSDLFYAFDHQQVETLRTMYCQWEIELEKRFADNLVQQVCHDITDYLLYTRFDRLIGREIQLIGKNPVSRLLFIGSGYFPITVLCFQKHLRTSICCIDHSVESVNKSLRVISSIGYHNIDVLHKCGSNIDASKFDVIIVALLPKPKKEILKNIAETCSDSSVIICRTSHGSRQVFYEPTTYDAIPNSLQICDMAIAGNDDTISSLLLRRNKSHVRQYKIKFSSQDKSVSYLWAKPFKQKQQIETLQLMNLVIERETTIGYRWPVEWQKGMDLMNETARAVHEGCVHLLLMLNSKQVIVGHVLLVPSHLPNCAYVGELSRMFVHPEYRSMSMVRGCIKSIVKRSKAIGVEILRLDVRADTQVERLWKMMGFEPFGAMKDYARVDGQSYAGTFMQQRVDVLMARFVQEEMK